MEKKKKKIRVVELFAGVGGFRLGLEGVTQDELESSAYKVVWSNQWEPSTKMQHASMVYESQFEGRGGIHSNEDIFEVINNPEKFKEVQKANPDMLVGGFPCQDYSVAKPLNKSKGLVGEKGVLWWSIYGLLEKRLIDAKPIKYLILENVDRLIKSPTSKRGRDFAIMLSSLFKLGYAVEWRVVNAADYGFPQRRRRIFIVAYHSSTKLYKRLLQKHKNKGIKDYLYKTSVIANALPVLSDDSFNEADFFEISNDPHFVTENYLSKANGKSLFENSGIAINGRVWTAKVEVPVFSSYVKFVGSKKQKTLGDVISKTKLADISEGYLIDETSKEKWRWFKGPKSIERTKKNGITYTFDEGGMDFPDKWSKPSRTIITGEGGASPSRFKHIVEVSEGSNQWRRLIPEELEELNGFPRGFTRHPEVADIKRAFFMGNALVVGVVKLLAKSLSDAV